jgi:hypothetical protein
MKTKAALLRLITMVVMVTIIHITGVSQDKDVAPNLPKFYSYVNNHPVSFEHLPGLDLWMICDVAFESSSELCFEIEEWMLGDDYRSISFNGNMPVLADWMLADGFEADDNDWLFMEWMFEFEPFVVGELLLSVEMLQLDEWMFEVHKQKFDVYSDTQLEEWMLSEDFGLAGSN